MTTFEDGPAKGQKLSLQRAAKFLRVVEKDGKFDALDQLEDTPAPDEKITPIKSSAMSGGVTFIEAAVAAAGMPSRLTSS